MLEEQDVFTVLSRVDIHAQDLLISSLRKRIWPPGQPHLSALRLTSRTARAFVDGAVQQLTVSRAGAEAWQVGSVFDWSAGVSRAEGVVARLPTRWPRCTSLNLLMEAKAEDSVMDNRTTEEGARRYNLFVSQLRAQVPLLQQGLAAALVRQAAVGRQLRELELQYGTHHVEPELPPALLQAVAAAFPNLTSLSLTGSCAPPGDGGQQQEVYQALASLPRLSSLALPGPAGLQHVPLLAGQLTRLKLRDPGDVRDDPTQERTMIEAARALCSLTCLVSLCLSGWWCDTDALQELLASPPPTLRRLNLVSGQVQLTWAGGRLDTVTWGIAEPDDLGRLMRPLAAGGVLTNCRRLRKLQIKQLYLEEEPATAENATLARELLKACDSVNIKKVTTTLKGVPAECFTQVADVLQVVWGRDPSKKVTVKLWDPFDGDVAVPIPIRLYAKQQDPRSGQLPVRELGPAPPPPTALDFLRPLVCAPGSSRYLLLWSPGLADDDAGRLEAWLQGVALIQVPYVQSDHFPQVPCVTLAYRTAEDAAAVARALRVLGVTYDGCDVLVLHTPHYMTVDWFQSTTSEVMRAYIERNRDTSDFADLWAKALEGWEGLVQAIGDPAGPVSAKEVRERAEESQDLWWELDE